MPRTGLPRFALRETSNASYVERPVGKSMSFWPSDGLMPANAHVGQGKPPVASPPESRPLDAKSEIVAPPPPGCKPGHAAIAALIVATPQAFSVAAIAACAFGTFRNRASPTLLVSVPNR